MDNFFISKLNTALLFILIILMIIAISIMLKDKEKYLAPFSQTTAQISGNRDDLVSFSVLPGAKVSGFVPYQGVIKGGYFFEGNILINILDVNQKLIKAGNAMATGEWMTAGPVAFEGKLDLSDIRKGSAYIEIHNDNPSDIRANDKSILIPIVVE